MEYGGGGCVDYLGCASCFQANAIFYVGRTLNTKTMFERIKNRLSVRGER